MTSRQPRNIQTEILTRLLQSEPLHYHEVKPSGVENDLYNYHLQFLVNKGLVEKQNGLYALTDQGKYYVNTDHPINPLGQKISKYKANVLTVVIDTSKETLMVLNQTRKRHPFYNHRGIMGGPINPGEPLLEAAKRKLAQETGLNGEFQQLGVVRTISLKANDQIFADTFFFPCLAVNPSGSLITRTPFGENYWVDIDQAIKHESTPSAPALKLAEVLIDLKRDLTHPLPFFYAEEIRKITAI